MSSESRDKISIFSYFSVWVDYRACVLVGHKCPFTHRRSLVCAYSLKVTELPWKMTGILIVKMKKSKTKEIG